MLKFVGNILFLDFPWNIACLYSFIEEFQIYDFKS